MPPLRHVPFVVALLATAAVVWVLISRASDRARWLRVEVPDQIVRGGRIPLIVRLADPLPAGMVRADLHWKNARRESRGTLSTARPQLIRDGQSEYRFDLPVPALPGLEYVYGVVYLSPTGQWANRSRACTTDPLAVSTVANPAMTGQLRRVTAHDQAMGPPPKRQDSRAARWTSALLWSLTGILAWRMRVTTRAASPPATPPRHPWGWLALACLLAAAWEASAAEAGLGDLLRRLAMARGWYDGRRPLQEALTVIVIAVSLVFAAAALRRNHAQPVSLVFSSLDVYGGIAAVSFISLHDADAWLATPVFTIPIVQVVKLAAAVIAASGAARALLAVRAGAADPASPSAPPPPRAPGAQG